MEIISSQQLCLLGYEILGLGYFYAQIAESMNQALSKS